MGGRHLARIPLEGMCQSLASQHQRRSRVAALAAVRLAHGPRHGKKAFAREVVGVGVNRLGAVQDADPRPQDLAAGGVLDLGVEQRKTAGRLVLDEDLGEVGAVAEGRVEHVADQTAIEELGRAQRGSGGFHRDSFRKGAIADTSRLL
ncbi:hypothetical protein D3C86_1717940 [compost metagenome]